MAYLGNARGLDFMQSGDSIYYWAFGAWRLYCRLVDWLTSLPGRLLRRAFVGIWVTVDDGLLTTLLSCAILD